jgi:hypothetical protein
MDKKSTFIILGILIVAVIVFIGISFKKSSIDTDMSDMGDTASTSAWENMPAENPDQIIVTQKTVVTAKHAYVKGTHTVAGEIPLPTPCHILEAAANISADKMTVVVALTSSVKTDEVCAQVITPARFKVTAKAPKDAHISATLNGQEVTLNLIEAAAGENLDSFELYIKG